MDAERLIHLLGRQQLGHGAGHDALRAAALQGGGVKETRRGQRQARLGSAQPGSAQPNAAAARSPGPFWPYLLFLCLRACWRAETSRGLRVAARGAVATVEVTWERKGRAVRGGGAPNPPTSPCRSGPHLARPTWRQSPAAAGLVPRAPRPAPRQREPITTLLLPTASGGESQSPLSFFRRLPAARANHHPLFFPHSFRR